ncbi:exonuclease SbcC [Pediococcus damnosus]|uniref:exonuclease SbcC n=1 Tax=Pediococcus damnosus TaxID=51663 RepID=UPI000C1FB9D1|nr:exonuclease SbcC [Pediococcus damnosus]PJE48697.1 exonuclease SbcC [Pediococcus damnosus]
MSDEKNTTESQEQPNARLKQSLSGKIAFLNALQTAVDQQDDRLIYELLDPERYHTEVSSANDSIKSGYFNLVEDVRSQIGHYLSYQLIDYLAKIYPFFYYREVSEGEFKILFGNWWDRREFGFLDVLNLEFQFDKDEYQKLQGTFELDANNKHLNTENIAKISEENKQLQDLVANQDQRDQRKAQLRDQLQDTSSNSSFWESGKVKEERQAVKDELTKLTDEDQKATDARGTMKRNEDQILALSKEDTILSYEKQAVKQAFGSFEAFTSHSKKLYADYLMNLIGKDKVSADE